MSLGEYAKKRNLKKSGEPSAKIKSSGKKIFVIHEHHASHLHWDLRLEMDGVLAKAHRRQKMLRDWQYK